MSIETVDAKFALSPREDRIQNALANSEDFEIIKRRLLRPEHYKAVHGKQRVIAAGWGCIFTALGMSVEVLSLGSDGRPGARREVLEDHKNNRIISFSVMLRVTWQGRIVEMPARCDTSESFHMKLYSGEHKLEAVAYTRAHNRAVCKIVGGEPGDIAEDVEEIVDQKKRSAEPVEQVPVAVLLTLWQQAGSPDASLGVWLTKNKIEMREKKLTPASSRKAFEMLSQLAMTR